MESKDLLKKQELAEELGMKFEEASVLFSEETLGTMRMMNVVGGNDDETNSYCNGGNCVEGCGGTNSGCTKPKGNCNPKGICDTDVNGKKCETTTPDPTTPTPTVPTTPTDPTTPPGPGTTTTVPEEPTTPIGPGENLPEPTRP